MERLTHRPSPEAVEGTDCPQWYADLLLGMLNRTSQIGGDMYMSAADLNTVYGRHTAGSIVEVYNVLRKQ